MNDLDRQDREGVKRGGVVEVKGNTSGCAENFGLTVMQEKTYEGTFGVYCEEDTAVVNYLYGVNL